MYITWDVSAWIRFIWLMDGQVECDFEQEKKYMYISFLIRSESHGVICERK